MGRRPRQLLLVADGERAHLPPEVAARAAKAMGRLVLQRLRIEEAQDPGDEDQREGGGDDPRS
jgi:hypothetical protein